MRKGSAGDFYSDGDRNAPWTRSSSAPPKNMRVRPLYPSRTIDDIPA